MPDLSRKIIHIDLDAFYPSVEQRDNPELRGKPVIVGGDPHTRGVVASASYEARSFGVHSAQACKVAQQLCPQAIFVRPRFEVYKAISRHILALYQSYTPLVEPLALDEAYLDVSALVAIRGSTIQLAREIKQTILDQTGLTASAGISYNKALAKLASAHRKPDGLTVITPQIAPTFLQTLPISKIFGVGEVTEARLKGLGITTGGELLRLSLEEVHALFGKRGQMFYQLVRGEDNRAVQPDRERKSLGKETTFAEDLSRREDLLEQLEELAVQVAQRLDDLQLVGRTVTLKLRWQDFALVTRSVASATPVRDAATMIQVLTPLLDQLLREGKSIRLLGITLSNLMGQRAPGRPFPSLWDALEATEGEPIVQRERTRGLSQEAE